MLGVTAFKAISIAFYEAEQTKTCCDYGFGCFEVSIQLHDLIMVFAGIHLPLSVTMSRCVWNQ